MRFFFLLTINFIFFFALCAIEAHAGLIDDLKEKISGRNTEVKKLEEEIKKYQDELERINGQAKTLSSALGILGVTEKKVGLDMRITGERISRAELSIEALTLEIEDKGRSIVHNETVLGDTLRQLNELEERSLLEIFLAHNSFSDFWSDVQGLGRFQSSVQGNLANLEALKVELVGKKRLGEQEKTKLLSYKRELGAQKNIIAENKKEKERLLKDTKNKESGYKELLEDRLKQKEALEKEIEEFEARLRVEIDPASLPPTGTGVLAWPLGSVKVTQYFGNTPFASANPQVYNGGGHNGVDFRAPMGTTIKVSANGIVVDTGDTDQACYKVSYGKWVLVEHYNGLSTLYAHLSSIAVTKGETVAEGQIVGYSGNTGYSTGPHLHFGAYASKAVAVTDQYKSKICGTNLKLPLSPRNGYLNPLSYLPQ